MMVELLHSPTCLTSSPGGCPTQDVALVERLSTLVLLVRKVASYYFLFSPLVLVSSALRIPFEEGPAQNLISLQTDSLSSELEPCAWMQD